MIQQVFDPGDTSMVFPSSMNRYQEGIKVSHSDLPRQVSDELEDRMWTILDFNDDGRCKGFFIFCLSDSH